MSTHAIPRVELVVPQSSELFPNERPQARLWFSSSNKAHLVVGHPRKTALCSPSLGVTSREYINKRARLEPPALVNCKHCLRRVERIVSTLVGHLGNVVEFWQETWANRRDSLAMLADWYEERGESPAAVFLRLAGEMPQLEMHGEAVTNGPNATSAATRLITQVSIK